MKEVLHKPIWPVIVFDENNFIESYSKDDWFSDADLCDAHTWGKNAQLIDSSGKIFDIKHTIVKKEKIIGLIPVESVTNYLIPTMDKIKPNELLKKILNIKSSNSEKQEEINDYKRIIETTNSDKIIVKSIEHFLTI
jgi:hypothetical protein